MSEIIRLQLEALADGLAPGLPVGEGQSLAEAAAAALDMAGHVAPAALSVSGADNCDASIEFAAATDQIRRGYADENPRTERGAVAIALCYMRARHGQLVARRARRGEHVDYYLTTKTIRDDPPFAGSAKAEITGIANDSNGAMVAARRVAKHRQVGQSVPQTLPCWILYVRFNKLILEVDCIAQAEAA